MYPGGGFVGSSKRGDISFGVRSREFGRSKTSKERSRVAGCPAEKRRRRRGIFRHLDGINGIEKNEIKLIVDDPNVNS